MDRFQSDGLQRFWDQLQREGMDREAAQAAADPARHKLTTVFPPGARLNYRFGGWVKVSARRKVGYCWSTRRNAAGYFLGWREVETARPKPKRGFKPGDLVSTTRRDQYTARKTKAALAKLQLARTAAHRSRLGTGE